MKIESLWCLILVPEINVVLLSNQLCNLSNSPSTSPLLAFITVLYFLVILANWWFNPLRIMDLFKLSGKQLNKQLRYPFIGGFFFSKNNLPFCLEICTDSTAMLVTCFFSLLQLRNTAWSPLCLQPVIG